MITNSTQPPIEDKPSNTVEYTKQKKEEVLICHTCHKENHFASDYKANLVKDKSFYLRMS